MTKKRRAGSSHPGAMLAGMVIPATGNPKAELARLPGISRQTIYDVLNERQPVTPGMAVRLGKLFGNWPALRLAMQSAHSLWRAEQAVDTSAIPTLETAA